MPEIPGLREFLVESNRIEGIPANAELHLKLAEDLIDTGNITIGDMYFYVKEITRGRGELRDKNGMNVRVGEHRPPSGGIYIPGRLGDLMKEIRTNARHPYLIHHDYETLHPFMDGNGRSGRLLWAWQMLRFGYWPGIKLGFLHAYYYQSLQFGRIGRGT